MSAAFIGCKISLISKSEIRYEGILYTIDTKESTIALAKVRSFGTEDRQTDKPVAPRNEVYEYIIFRASDIKDLIVDDPPANTPGLSDPAIIQAQSTGTSALPASTSYASATTASSSVSTSAASKNTLSNVLASAGLSSNAQASTSRGSTPTHRQGKSSPVNVDNSRRGFIGQNRENRNFNQQNQQRNAGGSGGRQFVHQQQQPRGPHQPRQQQNQQQGGRMNNNYNQQGGNRGGRQQQQGQRPPFQNRPMNFYQRQQCPNNFQRTPRTGVTKLEEYDFEKANLEFTELEKGISTLNVNDKEADAENENENAEEPAYDKQKSFFDAISCEALERSKGTNPRPDRRHERKLNEETFGVSGNFRNFRRGGYGGGRGYNNRGYGGRNYSNRGNYQRRGSDNRRRSANNGSDAGAAAAPAGTAPKAQTADA